MRPFTTQRRRMKDVKMIKRLLEGYNKKRYLGICLRDTESSQKVKRKYPKKVQLVDLI